MNQTTKVWSKLIEKKILTDYSTNLPTIKEWIYSISTFKDDLLVIEEFNEKGILQNQKIIGNDDYLNNEFDENGFLINSEHTTLISNPHGDAIEITEDKNSKIVEELKYDEKGRVIRKDFIINGELHSYLEFKYDDVNNITTTLSYKDNKLEFYEEDIYVSEEKSITLFYDSNKKVVSKTEHIFLDEDNLYIISTYDSKGKLLKRIEENRNNDNTIKEQKIFDSNNELTLHIIFGDNDEYGYRKSIRELEYDRGKLLRETITVYEYEYWRNFIKE